MGAETRAPPAWVAPGVAVVKKLVRIVRFRWKLVLIAALAGGLVGAAATVATNRDIQPLFEAVASVEFDSGSSERDREGFLDMLSAAEQRATQANDVVIAARQGVVTSDAKAGQLLFTSRSDSEETAVAVAGEMRDSYITATIASETGARARRMEEITNEAAEVLASIAALTPAAEPVVTGLDPETQARLDTLNALLAGLTQQSTRLEVDLILAESGNDRVGTPDEIRLELEGVLKRLDEIYTEIAELTLEHGVESARRADAGTIPATPAASPESRGSDIPIGPVTADGLTDTWTVQALQERYQALADEFASLFMAGQEQETVVLTPVSALDMTPERQSPALNSALGFLFAAALATGSVYGEAHARRRIFVPADTGSVPTLVELPGAAPMMRAPSRRFRRRRWMGAVFARRMDGIKRLRTGLLALAESSGRPVVVGLARVKVPYHETRILTLDLAHRLALSDRQVLVLDLDCDTDWPHRESDSPVTVADLTESLRRDPEAGTADMKRMLADLMETEDAPVIAAGWSTEDPADLVLTSAFDRLLETARESADMVIVIVPSASDPITLSLTRRLDVVLGVCGVGRSSMRDVLAVGNGASTVDAVRLGVVLLTGPLSVGPNWRNRLSVSAFRVRLGRSLDGEARKARRSEQDKLVGSDSPSSPQ
jgi:hypothetical protein